MHVSILPPYPLILQFSTIQNCTAWRSEPIARWADGKAFPLSLRLIKEIHALLLKNTCGGEKEPGEFRRTLTWLSLKRVWLMPSLKRFTPFWMVTVAWVGS